MSTVPGGGVDSQYMYDPAYDDEFFKIFGAAPQWTAANTQTELDQYGNDFVQQFTNATGRAPTSDEINQFFSQAVAPVGNTSAGFASTDPNAVVSSYVPQQYQTLIQQNQAAQLPNLETQIANMGTAVGQQTAQQLADPTGGAYQAFSGSMNNMGITPSSGAFASGLGSTIGNAASGAISQGLTSVGFPAITGNQSPSLASLSGAGQSAETAVSGNNENLYNFDLQAALAQQLAKEGDPSAAQSILGMATGAAGGASSAAQGISAAKGLSWVCTAMRNAGVLSKEDVRALHKHLYRAFWRRPLKFIQYLLFGKMLVLLANRMNTAWSVWKPQFFDEVMAEKDPAKAVDLYEQAFWSLYDVVKARLSYKHNCTHGALH